MQWQLLKDRRILPAIAGMLAIVLLAGSPAYAPIIQVPQRTTIHVEDPELCGAYPVFTKELAVKKVSGRPLSYDAYAGRQYIIEALLSADCHGTVDKDGNYPFVALIEIRDSGGITKHLFLQHGAIEPWTELPVGVSWVPDAPGEYEIRTFSMSDPNGRIFMTKIASISVTVVPLPS